jgi:PAS domain S-box-containing protein
LRESEERFRRALENIPDVVVIYDADLRIRYINAATLRLVGRPTSDYIGKLEQEVWPPEVYETYLPTLQETLDTGLTRSLETDLLLPEGKLLNLRITCVPLLDENGNVREILGITHDMTVHRQAEEELKKHRDHLEDLVAERTNELRKLVNAMAGREVRMAELKNVIRKLRAQLQDAGLPSVADDPLLEGPE